jgi:UDP-3-O-[3-hydroxymyristoyl] glucosamine N-acyltransferase
MIRKRILLEEIITFLGDKVIDIEGPVQDVFIDNLAEMERVNETTLDWIKPSKLNKQEIAEQSKAHVLLVDKSVAPIEGKTVIHVKSPKLALALIGNHFFVEPWQSSIHPTALIHPEARIGVDCYIGPYTVIGKSIIGSHTYIDSHVRIYDGVEMGHDCSIKAGAVIGGAGFGYEKDEEGNRFHFPQIGQLIMGSYVEVGSNTCIDRGALADTVIGDYTKINNLCHIAHNNKIGKNVMITGCVNISGSNIIDDNVWIAPNSSIRGWVHIEEGATVGMGAVVVKDIPAHETWVGNPARKLEKKK